MEDLTGKQLGQYQIIVPLGEGGMAAVYKAYQLGKINRYVAVKILPQQLAKQPEFVKRFDREANVLAKLQHPRILPVFDFGESDGYTYLVMPFIESGTLADLLHGKPLPLPQIRSLTVQIAEALDYAHSHRLVHRDVKPSNVLVDERGNCLLSDFGITKILEGTEKFTSTGGIIGTPAYMSPEQGRGETLDRRSDIYSLGVMLYEMATGRVPFRADTPLAVIIKHMQDPLPPPRSINPALPEAVEQVIFKALAKYGEDRFQTAAEMARAIQAAIPESTMTLDQTQAAETLIEGWAETIRRKKVKPKARVPKWIWAVGGLVLIVLGAVAVAINASAITGTAIRTTETAVPPPAILAVTEESTVQPTARLPSPSPIILTATHTPQSTAEPTSEVVSGALVTFQDSFDNSFLLGWDTYDDVFVQDGVLYVRGNSNWPSVERKHALRENEAFLVLFRYNDETHNFNMRLETGDWNNPTNHKYLGFYLDPSKRFSTALLEGTYNYGGDLLRGNLDPAPDRWYFALFRIEGPTEFSMQVWEKDDPTRHGEYYYQMSNEWKDKSWRMGASLNSGILELDSYQEIRYIQSSFSTATAMPTSKPTTIPTAATEVANWAVSFPYNFPVSFWSVGTHRYTLSASCPTLPDLNDSNTFSFQVSDSATLFPAPIYLRRVGLRTETFGGGTIVGAINPAQSTIAIWSVAEATRTEIDLVVRDCRVSISWDGSPPQPLIAQAPFQR